LINGGLFLYLFTLIIFPPYIYNTILNNIFYINNKRRDIINIPSIIIPSSIITSVGASYAFYIRRTDSLKRVLPKIYLRFILYVYVLLDFGINI